MSQGETGAIGRRRPYAGAVGALAIGLLLAGCSASPPEPTDPPTTTAGPTDDAEPTGDQTSDPTEVPTPDPAETVQPPEWDPAMDEPTLDGAFAFGEYFMDLYSYVAATNDTELWLELSHPECQFCASTVDHAEQGTARDIRVELVRISGEQVNDEYYDLSYQLRQWVAGAADEAPYVARIGVLNVNGQWQTRAVQIDEGD